MPIENNPVMKGALVDLLLTLADDELILAHRDSEWTGHAPILEEDIAFANIAQDELGHAILWYRLIQALSGADPDHLVFFRDPNAYRNVQMVELPNGDWAFSMLRQYLFDAAELTRLAALADSQYQPIKEVAAKIQREEIYHLRHTQNWVKRLGMGTDESRRRSQAALDTLWPLAQQLFEPWPHESRLQQEGILAPAKGLHQNWIRQVTSHLEESGLKLPDRSAARPNSRAEHTPHLSSLLAEMQIVPRLFPEADW